MSNSNKFGFEEIQFTGSPPDIRVVQRNFERIEANAPTIGEVNGIVSITGAVTLPYTGWTDNTQASGYWVRDVAVQGMRDADGVVIGPVLSGTDNLADGLIQAAYNMITLCKTGEGALTFYAHTPPAVNIPILWKMGGVIENE